MFFVHVPRKLIPYCSLLLFLLWGNTLTAAEERFEEAPFSKLDSNHNLGLVIKNKYFTIYRSGKLGEKGLKYLKKYLTKESLPFPKTILHMNSHGYKRSMLHNRFALEEHRLQKDYGFKYFHSFDYQNRVYLDGYNPYQPRKDIDSEEKLGDEAINAFGDIDHEGPDGGIDALLRILNIILEEGKGPVLYHCTGGMHRTGIVSLVLRYIQGGHWVNGPKKIVRPLFKERIALNPAQYEYYLHNKMLFRLENLNFVEEFSRDPRFLELVELYRDKLNAQ